jgi:simple sugar transport system permease protein
MNFKKLLLRNETALIIAIIVLSIVIGAKSPEFFTLSTLFDIFRSSFVQLLFALGVLVVIISGGIDVSFPAVGIFAGYTAVVLMQKFDLNPNSLMIPIVLAILIGIVLGALNSLAIASFGIPTLIATRQEFSVASCSPLLALHLLAIFQLVWIILQRQICYKFSRRTELWRVYTS